MKAFVLESFKTDSPFIERDIPLPPAGIDEVQIKVLATSVNPIDCKIRNGLVPAISPDFPAVLHGDFSGHVVSLGENVKGYKTGDEVFGCGGGVKGLGGALAERMNVNINLLAKAPANLTLEQAAALPLVSITAWQALFNKANISLGQKVLIHGGCGGVGHIAVQLAKAAGAEVTTTVSSQEKAEIARSLGADHVVNYSDTSVAEYVETLTQGEGFDVVLDTVGGENLDLAFQAVCLGGQVVTIAARSTHDLTPLHSKGASLHVVFMLAPLLTGKNNGQYAKILQYISSLIERSQLRPLIDKHQFTMNQVAQAHEHLVSGAALGKIIIKGLG